MTEQPSPLPRLGMRDLTDAADRFRDWSRSEAGADACFGVSQGSLAAEHVLLKAFVESINPPDHA